MMLGRTTNWNKCKFFLASPQMRWRKKTRWLPKITQPWIGKWEKKLKKTTTLKRMNKNKRFTCLDLSEIFIKFPVLFPWKGWRFIVWREWLLDFSMVEIHHILWGLKSESKTSYWIARSSVSFHSTSKK